MADRTTTYNSAQWQVWAYVPEVNRFVLNFSKLDSGTLGSVGGFMNPYAISPTNITIIEGSEVSQGIFLPITTTTATVNFSIENFTPDVAKDFYVGNEIWITLANEETVEDDIYGFNTPIFIGDINSFDVQIEPGSNFGTITVTAVSKLQKTLNTQISVTKSTTLTKGEVLNARFSELGIQIDVDASDSYNYATNTKEDKSVGEFIEDYLVCETYGLSDHVYKPSSRYSDKLNYGYSAKIIYPNAAPYTPIDTVTDYQMTSMDLNWSGLDAPTSVSLTQYQDREVTYNFGLSGSSGFNYSGTIDVKDITQMEQVGQRYLSMFQSFEPVSISTITANTYQDITFKEISVLGISGYESHWLYPSNLYEVGEMVEIYTEQIGTTIIDDAVIGNFFEGIIIGRTIEVTPDNWTTTYNLWKGFTN